MTGDDDVTIHGGCVLWGEAGLLIRGESGSGKSMLASRLITRAAAEGRFARLVADDRVRLSRRSGRIVARPVPAIAGRIEIRGVGIMAVPYEPAAVVRLVVECGRAPARMPEPDDWTDCLGIPLPRIALPAGHYLDEVVLWRLRALDDTLVTAV